MGWPDHQHRIGVPTAAFVEHKTEISFLPPERNWTGYDRLAFAVYSNDPHIRMLSLRLYDEAGGDRNKAKKYHYFDADRKIMVTQGWNHVEVRLRNLQAASQQRPIALDQVLRLVLSAPHGESLPWSVRLGDIRLIKGLETSSATRTAHPGDILTIIDNQWFVTRQVEDRRMCRNRRK